MLATATIHTQQKHKQAYSQNIYKKLFVTYLSMEAKCIYVTSQTAISYLISSSTQKASSMF